ncbi:RICIN domain-containing protein [Streptomyces sp. NPDC050504]|uniref:RICIN domain-containing protein n=1 Tax=Streptomyces sp. NPDC050504 TaxID=3365618 RepID=UPI0037A87A43
MKLARWLSTAAASVLAAVALSTAPASAAPSPASPAANPATQWATAQKAARNAEENAPASAAAATPTVAKHFLGTGYGPLNIATDAAYNTAFAQAVNEGYQVNRCALSAGPVPNQIGSNYYQVLLEIYCTPPPPPGSGRIVGVHSNKCLDVKGGSLKDGTPVQIYDCNGTDAQAWRLEGDGTVRALGRCMDVNGAQTANGTLISLHGCHQGLNQKWELLPGGLLRSVHSGKCLDVLGWGTGNGSRVGIWDCAPAHTNQQWRGGPLGS